MAGNFMGSFGPTITAVTLQAAKDASNYTPIITTDDPYTIYEAPTADTCVGDILLQTGCNDWALDNPGKITTSNITDFCADHQDNSLCSCINSPLIHATLPIQCDSNCVIHGYQTTPIHEVMHAGCSYTDCRQIINSSGANNMLKNVDLSQKCNVDSSTAGTNGSSDGTSDGTIFGMKKYVFIFIIILIVIIVITPNAKGDVSQNIPQYIITDQQ